MPVPISSHGTTQLRSWSRLQRPRPHQVACRPFHSMPFVLDDGGIEKATQYYAWHDGRIQQHGHGAKCAILSRLPAGGAGFCKVVTPENSRACRMRRSITARSSTASMASCSLVRICFRKTRRLQGSKQTHDGPHHRESLRPTRSALENGLTTNEISEGENYDESLVDTPHRPHAKAIVGSGPQKLCAGLAVQPRLDIHLIEHYRRS